MFRFLNLSFLKNAADFECVSTRKLSHTNMLTIFLFFKLSAVLRACIGTCVHVCFVSCARKEKN